MDVLRTPDERFEALPDFPFAPNYIDVDGLRLHYVDEGAPEVAPILLLHGEPSWSFLYRSMVAPLVEAGHRVIALDLVGFGRSDKPAAREEYTFERHVGWVRGAIEALELQSITLVCQDWGGLIGLRLAAENADRFARISAGNTFLPTGDIDPGPAFRQWRDFSQRMTPFDAGRIVAGAVTGQMDPSVIDAYRAPFPDERYCAGARQFPMLVPATPDDPASAANREAWETLKRWERPFLCVFSDGDPVTRGADAVLRSLIPGCEGQPHRTVHGGHFLQEDAGAAWADALIDWLR